MDTLQSKRVMGDAGKSLVPRPPKRMENTQKPTTDLRHLPRRLRPQGVRRLPAFVFVRPSLRGERPRHQELGTEKYDLLDEQGSRVQSKVAPTRSRHERNVCRVVSMQVPRVFCCCAWCEEGSRIKRGMMSLEPRAVRTTNVAQKKRPRQTSPRASMLGRVSACGIRIIRRFTLSLFFFSHPLSRR